MEMLKKLVAILLVLTTMLGMLVGCATYNNREYLSKGEFYSLFIDNTNMCNDGYSEKTLTDYKAAESLLYDFYLLDDEQINAYNGLVTKEIVAQVCVRYMEFRKSCEVEIKDIKKCHDEQAVKDAVGMKIFTLENGYFDAKQNMTVIDCQKAIDKMLNIELNSHYEEGELEIEFKDDVVVLDESIEITDFGIVDGNATATPISFSNNEVKINTLSRKDTNTDDPQMTLINETTEELWLTIPRHQYSTLTTKPAVGKVMIKPYFSNNFGQFGDVSNQHLDFSSPVAIMVTKIDEHPMEDPFNVRIYGRLATAEEYLTDSENEKKINKKNCSKGATIKKVSDSSVPKGVNIDVTSKPGYLVVTFGHTFTITDKIYGKQTWRNPSASPSVNITAEIGNFTLDTKNIGKLILNKAASAEVKLTYDTCFNITLKAGGLRYSPANNGNGGLKYSPEKGFTGNFFANVGNARFTGASAGGSKSIKLAQVNISLGSGFSINTNLYMVIELDGTISFTTKATNVAELKVTKTRSGYEPTFNTTSEKEENIDVNANLTLELQLTPNVSFFGLNIIDAVGKFGGTTDAMASLYSTKAKKSSAMIYATQAELSEQCNNGDFKYCIGSSFQLYLGYEFMTTKSVIGKFVINELGLKTPSDKFTIYSSCNHFEDGRYVDECTREADELDTNNEEEIKLGQYKVVLDEGSQISVAVESIPLSNKKLEANGGISVKTGNIKVATVTFNEATNTILITAVGEGSTEITVKIPKKKKGKTYYEQKISVTVVEDVTNTSDNYYSKDNNDSMMLLGKCV